MSAKHSVSSDETKKKLLGGLISFLQQCLSLCHSPKKLWLVVCRVSYLWLLCRSCLWWPFLTTILLAMSLSLWGRPAPGRFSHVPFTFHFLMMDLTNAQWLGNVFVSIPWLKPFTELLGVFFCLHGVARNTGPLDTDVFILQSLDTHWSHSGGLLLIAHLN